MEQYIHTLIPIDSEFAPKPTQVASFFGQLVSEFKFSPISAQGLLPRLMIAKPSDRLRWSDLHPEIRTQPNMKSYLE